MRRGLAICGAALICAGPTAAQEIDLAIPVDCDLSTECFIQQYVDTDPTGGAADFTCGPLSYDGHKGTDFALPSLTRMRDGVDILAAAPGVIRAVRDGMADVSLGDPLAENVHGRECGNGVVIDHGNGWETQYCHLRTGSLAVERGQRVATGDTLGQIGLSGRTVFPHLHFSVRKGGRVVDPFAPDRRSTCGEAPMDTLWADPVAYTPGGLIAAGFGDAVPKYADVKNGSVDAPSHSDTSSLVIWVYAFGARAGDVLRLSVDGPGGEVLAQNVPLDRTQAQLFRAVGTRAPSGGFAPGTYRGTAILLRDGAPVDEIVTEIALAAP